MNSLVRGKIGTTKDSKTLYIRIGPPPNSMIPLIRSFFELKKFLK